jgi:CTD kinase subunit beta
LQDVILSALYVSSKLHDTLKKPREIVLASYAVRFPDLMNKAKAKGGAGIGVVGEADVDPAVSLPLSF